MVFPLTLRTLARHKALIAGLGGVLAGFQVMLVVIGGNLQREGLFSQLGALIPSNFLASLGGTTIASCTQFVIKRIVFTGNNGTNITSNEETCDDFYDPIVGGRKVRLVA